MSPSGPPADDANALSASNFQESRALSDTETEYIPSLRILFIQVLILCIATALHILRRQRIYIFGFGLDNWVIMPPECMLYTGLVFSMGGPILRRDFIMVAKWFGRPGEPAA